jgi:diguanylate cyclase (GGDEF)-like protein
MIISMPGTDSSAFSYRPVMALLVALCLLFASQLAYASAVEPATVRVDSNTLRQGLSLAGEWRFQPGDDLAWAAPELDDTRWGNLKVPGRWPRGGYPELGNIAWYRLSLQLDPAILSTGQKDVLAVALGHVLSAYELYAGGELVGAVGKFPPLSEIQYDRERVFSIPSSAVDEQGRLVLALRVWGGSDLSVQAWSAGPSSGDYRLGEYRSLLLGGIVGELPGLMLVVLIFVFGLYHLYLYARNRSLETYLWFGLTAINIAVYGLMLTQWKYMTDLSFLTLKKIEFGSIYLFPAVAIQMLWSLLNVPINRMLRAYQVSFGVFAILVVAIPGHDVHFKTLHWEQVWLLPLMIYTPWLMFREARGGNREARTVAAGTFIFLATCINDMLIDLAHFETVRLAPLGFVAILVSMAVSLANRFTTMFGTLETEVAQRTAELSDANEQLAEAARVDHLTGLLNRRGFAEEVEAERQRASRKGTGFAVVLADVDHFKNFNDRHGHACGDHVLKRVSAILQERIRDVDRIARWGGEEFILLLPETDVEGAATLAEKLREAVADNVFEFGDERLGLTMTFGIASHRKGERLEACVARADTALYHGKERGRNKVMIGNYKGLTLVS